MVVDSLIRSEANGSISFGNYKLDKKSKVEDFPHNGDLLKVKTFKEITKLEKNGLFVYESVEGSSVFNFTESESGVSFTVEAPEDIQVTLGLEEDTLYEVFLNDANTGAVKTGLGGKLSISIELSEQHAVNVKVVKA